MTWKSIAIIVLAAGGSTRMGTAKQLLPYQGQSLLRRAVTTALGVGGPVVVVLGRDPAVMRAELHDLDVRIAENPNWAAGMGGSIRAGVREATAGPAVTAVVITLCDQPHVDATAIGLLVERFARGDATAVASRYAGTIGVPAIFGQAWFARLLVMDEWAGAKALLGSPEIAVVDLPAAAVDVDTPVDYARLTE